MPEMSEKTRQARDKLRATLKANPEYAKAFKETLDEVSTPENVKALSHEICIGMAAIQKAMKLSKGSEPID